MATPYDAIIRVRKREGDEAAQALRDAVELLAGLEERRAAARTAVAQEIGNAAADPVVRSDLYLLRMYAAIDSLARPIAEAEAAVEDRRGTLLQLLAETKALERVAENYREAQQRALDRAEQSQVDDRVAFIHGARERDLAGASRA